MVGIDPSPRRVVKVPTVYLVEEEGTRLEGDLNLELCNSGVGNRGHEWHQRAFHRSSHFGRDVSSAEV